MGKKYNLPLKDLSIKRQEIELPVHITCKTNVEYNKSITLKTEYCRDILLSDLFKQIEKNLCKTRKFKFKISSFSKKSFINKTIIINKETINESISNESIINYDKRDIMQKGVYVLIEEIPDLSALELQVDDDGVYDEQEEQDILDYRLSQLCKSQDVAFENFKDMMHEYKKKEDIFSVKLIDNEYMKNIQSSLSWTMREILIDWFYDLQIDCNLNNETIFASINYIDIYLSKNDLYKRDNLQLLGVVAIFLSTKTYEIIPQSISQLIYLSNDQYTRKQIILFEKKLLKIINWNVFQLTPYNLINPFIKILNIKQNSKEKFIIDLLINVISTKQYFLKIKLSKLIISIFYLSIYVYLENKIHLNNYLFIEIQKLFGYKGHDLKIFEKIHQILINLIKNAMSNNQISAIYRRFKNDKYLKKIYGSNGRIINIDSFPFNDKFIKYKNIKDLT